MEDKRRAPLNKTQKDVLLSFIQEHPELNSAHFTPSFTKRKAQLLWIEVGAKLNSIPNGANKNWNEWRRAWMDQKRQLKKKISEQKRHASGTGGDQPLDSNLDEFSMGLATFLKPTVISGHEDVGDSLVIPQPPSVSVVSIPAAAGIEKEEHSSSPEISKDSAAAAVETEVDPRPECSFKQLTKTPIRGALKRAIKAAEVLVADCSNRGDELANYHAAKLQELRLAREDRRKESLWQRRLKQHELVLKREEIKNQKQLLFYLKKLYNKLDK